MRNDPDLKLKHRRQDSGKSISVFIEAAEEVLLHKFKNLKIALYCSCHELTDKLPIFMEMGLCGLGEHFEARKGRMFQRYTQSV